MHSLNVYITVISCLLILPQSTIPDLDPQVITHKTKNESSSCVAMNGDEILNNNECTQINNTNSQISNDTNQVNQQAKEPINYDEIDFALDPSKYNYPYDCPGLKVGFECDYASQWSSRDNNHYFCDVDTVHINDMTYDLFVSKYLFKQPVLIDANLSDWSDIDFWSKKNWLKHYGNFPFEAGRSLELVLNSGIGAVNTTLKDYWNDPMQLHLDADVMGPYDHQFKEPLYIFDRSIWRKEDDFQLKHFHAPQYLFNTLDTQYGILFIGVTGTGATWHAHGETWAGVAYGRKRWFLYPPEVQPAGGFWPGYSTKDWLSSLYPHLNDSLTHIKDTDWNSFFLKNPMNRKYGTNDPNEWDNYGFLRNSVIERILSVSGDGDKDGVIALNSDSTVKDIISSDYQYKHNGLHKPIECIQKEGQLIYLPEFWWHAVLNLGDTVAAGIQTSDSYTTFMQEIDSLGEVERELSDKKRKQKHKPLLTDLEKKAVHYDMLMLHDRLGKFAPFNAVHQFFVGYEYLELKEFPLAEQYMEEALLMDPTNIEAYIGLARLYTESDKDYHTYLAERMLRIAYILNHNHPTIRERLIEMFEKQKNDDLIELVQKHEPLPPMIILTEEMYDAHLHALKAKAAKEARMRRKDELHVRPRY